MKYRYFQSQKTQEITEMLIQKGDGLTLNMRMWEKSTKTCRNLLMPKYL